MTRGDEEGLVAPTTWRRHSMQVKIEAVIRGEHPVTVPLESEEEVAAAAAGATIVTGFAPMASEVAVAVASPPRGGAALLLRLLLLLHRHLGMIHRSCTGEAPHHRRPIDRNIPLELPTTSIEF